jgi:hypothetical protein
MKTVLALFVLLLATVFTASAGGKSPGPYIGLHVQGDEYEGAKFVKPNTINGETKYFRILPDVTTRHFIAFQAFVAEDGASYGAALRLNDEGMRAMNVMCSTSQGRLARTIVNGKLLDIIHINQAPGDGRVIVWGGLNEEDLKLMSKKLKRLDDGQPGEGQGKKKKKSR